MEMHTTSTPTPLRAASTLGLMASPLRGSGAVAPIAASDGERPVVGVAPGAR
jgi:hypothetical protein